MSFISWLQSPSAVILEPKKIEPVTVSIVSAFICYEVMGSDSMILVFWMLSFKPTFSFSSFTFIKRLFSSSLLPAIRVVSSAFLRSFIFSWQSWFQLLLHASGIVTRIPCFHCSDPGSIPGHGIEIQQATWPVSTHQRTKKSDVL